MKAFALALALFSFTMVACDSKKEEPAPATDSVAAPAPDTAAAPAPAADTTAKTDSAATTAAPAKK